VRVRSVMLRLQRRRQEGSRSDGSSGTRAALARTAGLVAAGLLAAGLAASVGSASTRRIAAAPSAAAGATPVAAAAAPAVATAPALRLSSVGDRQSRTRAIFVVTGALGLLLVLASTLPLDSLRPPIVHEIVMLHRLDLALFGGSLLALVAALYLLTG